MGLGNRQIPIGFPQAGARPEGLLDWTQLTHCLEMGLQEGQQFLLQAGHDRQQIGTVGTTGIELRNRRALCHLGQAADRLGAGKILLGSGQEQRAGP